MQIKELNLKNFRNYENKKIEFSPDINIITGYNGVGKTNILEAITVLSNMKSFKNIHDSEIIMWGENSYFCSSVVENCDYSKFEIGCTHLANKLRKKAKIDSVEIKNISNYFGKLLTVIFAPVDINIINGSPDTRRRFFDSVISKIDVQYLTILSEFKKVLTSRNRLLKQIKDNGINDYKQLDVWDQIFSEKSAIIIEKRNYFLSHFREKFHQIYMKIADEDTPEMHYFNSLETINSDIINKKLKESRKRDIIVGSTGVGPQRDDYIMKNSSGTLFVNYASQGQRRTAAISLKICEYEIIESNVNKKCIILVDDIFSELDIMRRERMLEVLNRGNQVIFTAVNSDAFSSDHFDDFKSFIIETGGKISQAG